MKGTRTAACVALVGAIGCAPIRRTTRTEDQLIGTRQATDPPSSTALLATATPVEGGARVALVERSTCARYEVRDVRRLELTRRSANGWVLGFEWVLGLAATGTGGALLYVEQRPLVNRMWDPDQARYFNYGVLGIGAVLLLSAIVDTALASDGIRDLGRVAVPSDQKTMVACGDKPVAGEPLALRAGGKEAPIGRTGADGGLTVDWRAASPEVAALVEGQTPPKSGQIVARGAEVGSLALELARATVVERSWQAATEAGTAAAYADFKRRFPSERGGDADKRLREALDRDMDAAAAAALAARDAARAREVLAAWRAQAPDSTALAMREAEVAELERLGTAEGLFVELERLLAAADAAAAGGGAEQAAVDPLVDAAGVIAKMEKLTPPDDRLPAARQRFEAARSVRVAALLVEAKRLDKKKDGAGALRAAEAAEKLAPGDGKVGAAVAGFKKKEARRWAELARSHARKADLDAADAALVEAERLAPEDREVKKARQRVDERRAEEERKTEGEDQRAERAEEERRAREVREEQKRLEKEAREERKRQEKEARRAAAEEKRKQKEAEREERKKKRELAKLEARRTDEEKKRAAEEARRLADEKKTAAAEEERRKIELARAEAIDKQRLEDERRAREEREWEAAKAATARRAERERRREAAIRAVVSRAGASSRSLDKALPGTWVTSKGRVVLALADGGTADLAMYDDNGRLLGRRKLTWQAQGGRLVLGGEGAGALEGRARVKAGRMRWAGGTWVLATGAQTFEGEP